MEKKKSLKRTKKQKNSEKLNECMIEFNRVKRKICKHFGVKFWRVLKDG